MGWGPRRAGGSPAWREKCPGLVLRTLGASGVGDGDLGLCTLSLCTPSSSVALAWIPTCLLLLFLLAACGHCHRLGPVHVISVSPAGSIRSGSKTGNEPFISHPAGIMGYGEGFVAAPSLESRLPDTPLGAPQGFSDQRPPSIDLSCSLVCHILGARAGSTRAHLATVVLSTGRLLKRGSANRCLLSHLASFRDAEPRFFFLLRSMEATPDL